MNGTFPLSGNIDAKAFPFLVTDLHHHGATGSLKVDGPTYQKALYFRGGRILFGSSNDPRDQLGAILIDAGKLTPEQLEEVNAKVGPGNPLAKVLTDSGLVTQQELSEAAKAKVERILGDVLAYGEGSFEFEDGVLPKGAVDLKLNTERLILGAVRQIGDRSFVLGHLGSLEVVLLPAGGLEVKAAEMESDAKALATQMDGHQTLKDAIARTGLEEFDGAKIACGLLFLGLLRPAGGAPPAEAPRRREEDSPFFVAEAGQAELDLGATARMALSAPSVERAPTLPVLAPPSVHEAPRPLVPVDVPTTLVPPPGPSPIVPTAVVAPSPPAPVSFPFGSAEPPPPAEPPSEPGTTEPFPSFAPTAAPDAARDEPGSFPQIEPPSKRDLAALDALLSPRQSVPAPPPGPLRSSLPDFARSQSGGMARRSSRSGSGKAWLVLLTLLLLAAAGGTGWWWFYARQAPHRGPDATAHATPTPLPPPSLAPQVVEQVATPESTLAPVASPTALVAVPATPALATPALATPTARAAAPPTPPTGEPRTLLSAGRFADAARAYAARAQAVRSRFTVQILVACSDETIQKALQSVPSEELYIIPVILKGRSCYRLCWGSYASAPLAEDAQRRLPEYFRQGGALPRVVPVAAILP